LKYREKFHLDPFEVLKIPWSVIVNDFALLQTESEFEKWKNQPAETPKTS
jgi:hypothetical protein